MADPARRPSPLALAGVGILLAFALYHALATNKFPDFFIYRAGAVRGLSGESPYELSWIRALVADQFPERCTGDYPLDKNCGYFLPPMAVLLYAPFAAVPYPAAKVLWAVLVAVAGLAVIRLPELFRRPDEPPPPPDPVWAVLVPVILVVNFLALATVEVGQTTLVVVGCVAAGQWCFERRWPILGSLLWAVPFVKPHLALPLLPLAWYLGGWKRAAGVLAVVGGLNLIGATVVGGSPLFLRDYFDFLAAGHKSVVYNLAERNPEITSWNRLLIAFTEGFAGDRFLIEQTAARTLAGYAVWFALVVAQTAFGHRLPSPAWAAAAAVVGAVLCAQVLAYELVFLSVAVPWVRELFAGGWKVRGWLAAVLLVLQTIPYVAVSTVGIECHRPLGVALLAVLVLVGPVSVSAPGSSRPRE